MIDTTNYNDGKRGGKVRVRSHIEESDKKTLLVKDVPYGVTTTQLIDSILKANDQGKIKIKKVTDNTAAEVEIQIDLAPGISPISRSTHSMLSPTARSASRRMPV
jgi:topoisomerase-4 subunit A